MSSVIAAEKLLKNVLVEEKDKKETKIVPKDFYWDQIIFYLVSAILGLGFLDISVEFFRGSTVRCFIQQDDSPNRDHFTFVNDYCYGDLPNTQYYLIFVLIAAVFIIAPHYLWSGYFSKHFDFFFDLLKHLDRLHDPNTGEYDPLNFAYIEKLEDRFSVDSTSIFTSYKFKILVQMLTCIGTFLMNFLYFQSHEFSPEFTCIIELNSSVWQYDNNIDCVYNSLRLLWFLWIVAGILIGLIFFALLYGLMWCYGSHPAELGAKSVARFCYQSCLLPDKITLSPFYENAKSLFRNRRNRWNIFSFCWELLVMVFQYDYKQFLEPQIQNDLNFLLMKLYFSDSGHGQVFRDIQINKELKTMFEQDHERLHLTLRVHADMMKQQINEPTDRSQATSNRTIDFKQTFFDAGFPVEDSEKTVEYQMYSKLEKNTGIDKRDWSKSPFRNILYGFLSFVQNKKDNDNVALDIAFETKYGYSLILARAFSEVSTIYFDRYFRSSEKFVIQKKYAADYDITIYPDNLFSLEGVTIAEAEGEMTNLFESEEREGINLIMVEPITDRPKLVSTNLLVNKIYENRLLSRRATLIAVRPLLIGYKPVVNNFQQFKPPEGLFEPEDVKGRLLEEETSLFLVNKDGKFRRLAQGTLPCQDECVGIDVKCDNVNCIFEFCVYKYKGRLYASDDSSTLTHISV